MKQQLIFVSLLGIAVAGLSACKPEGGSADTSAPEPENVVARVNGQAIGKDTLEAQVQALSARGQSVSQARALEEVITVMLLAQKAEEKGIHEQREVQVELDRRRSSLLAQHLVRAELNAYEPSEEELRASYDEQFQGAGGATEFHARHILVKEDKAKAEAIIAELDNGADFAELAKERSEGPSASNGGDLGWFQANEMVQPFSEAVQGLEPGSYTAEPVKTQFGWHVALLEETREAQPPKFDEVRSQLRSQMVSQHLQQFVTNLRDSADVEIVDESLNEEAGDSANSGAGQEESSVAADE